MEEQGKIISTCDVDSNLALQMWTRGKTPRLSIMNKNKNSRKLIHIAWVEKQDRTLSINGKQQGEIFTYSVKDFKPAIQKILAEYFMRAPNFKEKFAKLSLDLEKALVRPETIMSASELALMSEDKRSALWIADCSVKDKNRFLPFFPLNESEAAVISEDKLKIASPAMRNTESLVKSGVTIALKEVNPERWHNTIRVTAAAMLLGFSYCGADGVKTSDSIWSEGEKKPPKEIGQTAMKVPAKKISLHDPSLLKLGHKMTAYMRHYYAIDDIDIFYVTDSEKELQESGFSRSRRIDFNTGTLGDVPYRVTFFENESEGMTAFGCNPRMQTARHTGHMIIMLPTNTYKQSVKNDTFGTEDDFFTITRLLWAKQFKTWYETIKVYVSKFAGLKA